MRLGCKILRLRKKRLSAYPYSSAVRPRAGQRAPMTSSVLTRSESGASQALRLLTAHVGNRCEA